MALQLIQLMLERMGDFVPNAFGRGSDLLDRYFSCK